MKSLEPAQRVRRWHTYLLVWLVHRVLGLGLGALILLASLTGGLLVMHHELENVVERDRHQVGRVSDPPSPRQPIATLVAAVSPHAPPAYRAFRYMPGDTPAAADNILFVSPDGRGARWSAFVNPYTGEVLWHGADQALFTPWLLALHMHLHLGGWGYLITGASGTGLILLGLSGLYLYRDRFRSLFRNPFRRHRSARITFSDFHKWLGVVSLYFSVVLGVTGLIYCIKTAPGQIAAPKPLAAPFDFAKLTALEPLLDFTRTRFPEGKIQRVAFPTTAKAPLTLLVLEREAPVWRKFSRIEFDPATGAVRAIRDARDATPREKFAALLAPLHMGFYGAAWVKWLYVVGGFAPAVLALTGTAIWWLRTRATRRRTSDFLAAGSIPSLASAPAAHPAEHTSRRTSAAIECQHVGHPAGSR